jgi:hypothetical protein
MSRLGEGLERSIKVYQMFGEVYLALANAQKGLFINYFKIFTKLLKYYNYDLCYLLINNINYHLCDFLIKNYKPHQVALSVNFYSKRT